jgi:hypothetical protein
MLIVMTQERQQRRTSTLFQEPVHMLVMHEVSNQSVIKDVRESETVCTSHYSQFKRSCWKKDVERRAVSRLLKRRSEVIREMT